MKGAKFPSHKGIGGDSYKGIFDRSKKVMFIPFHSFSGNSKELYRAPSTSPKNIILLA